MSTPLQHLPSAAASGQDGQQLAQQFGDLTPPLSKRQALLEAERCLYCYDAPCTRICPTGIDVPGFIRQLAHGNADGAARTILQQNILGGSCARVCPTEVLCEDMCVRNHGEEKEPIKIGLLQRHALDAAALPASPFTRAPDSGKKVAVVGAGPAGLACAHELARLGHSVRIFERHAKPGGLNEYGIAKYKVPGDFAAREVEFVLSIGGIDLECGKELGRDMQLADLQRDYDAVFLGIGLGDSRNLGLEDEQAGGVLAAIDYIAELRQSSDLSSLPLPKQALVIGAGNTAIDIAVQLKRLGAQQVSIVYRRGAAQMSATWHEQEIAKQHQVQIITWARPEALMLQDGKCIGMLFARTKEENGKLVDTGSSFTLDADAVFKAVGQQLDAGAQQLGARLAGGKLAVDAHFRSSLPRVYAGGDCTAGQDLTVQAVQDGKLAARAIDSDLRSKEAITWPI
ncbi:NAD(P)-dependent oxidoreductase [Massilia sp. W12]|uniref:NAD(P)-dependent oxidoreductase n=1 Tax=Massilia sp. W12 TaxID=3126507 RepID=UPI0030CDE2F1